MAAPIFGRQRVMLHLLRQAKTGPTKVHLMKWLFLMGEETDVREHVPFYDFLPYRYGPFSFTVYQELARLEKAGLVTEDLHIAEGREREVDEITERLKPTVREAARNTLAEYGDLDHDELIDNVYARYDWYASRSELRPPRARKAAAPAVFTTGYEGESIDAFLDKLLRTGIGRVVDVRKNAYSQKYGFSGGPLKRMCGNVGIDYRHMPELGIPSNMRTDLSTRAKRQRLFKRYESELLPNQPDAQDAAADLLRERASVLLCVEHHPEDCHRGTLAPYLAASTGLDIAHV
jgi:uncharacterized protein (DUF488 family)